MSITPPEPSPIPSIPPGPENPPGPLETPPPITEPPPPFAPDEVPEPNPDENDNPPRQKLNPALIVSEGENTLTLSEFDDIRSFPFPDIEGARAIREMVQAAQNETEMILAASSFATWAKKHSILLDKERRR
jgi:hypothetical protein